MMRFRAVLPAVAVLALAPAGAGGAPAEPSAAATSGKCAMKGTKTVAKNRYARVFTRPSRGGDEIERLYGCLYSVNRRVWLDTSSDDEYVSSEEFSDVELSGRVVTWRHTSTDISCKADCPPGYDGTSERTMTANLRTRRITTTAGP